MKLIATDEEMLNIAYHVLTTGLPFFVFFTLSYNGDEYEAAKAELKPEEMPIKGTICNEDVQVNMLRKGYGLTFTNTENDDEETVLTLELIKKNWDTIPVSRIMDVANGDYDAEDADIIAQCMLFGEVIYG